MLGLALASGATAVGAVQEAAAVEVALATGTVTGIASGDGVAFRGIRYAEAPTGEQRWRAPRAQSAAAGLQADPVACPQPGVDRLGVPISEDCLQLNVWTPELAGSRPVMVWIHGGGFRTGTASAAIYEGSHFVADDVVLVTINYRLGALGFLAHPSLLEESAGGEAGVANFGLLDMIEALRWVRGNIEAFGGDPAQITIFGESAGGMAVQLLLSSPLASGLFDRAIAMSGYGTWPLPRTDGRGPADQRAQAIAGAIVKTAGASADATAEELRALSVEALVGAVEGLHLPVVDGVTLLDEPGATFEAGRQNRVPTIFGGNSYDGAVLLMAGMSPTAYLDSWSAEERERILRLYATDAGVSSSQAAIRLFGDARYLLAGRTLARAATRQDVETYLYYFAYVPTALRGRWPGAPHAVEVGMLFGNTSVLSGTVDEEWLQVSRQLRSDFVRFARGEAPAESWPRYDADRLWRVYGAHPVTRSKVIGSRLDFLEDWYRGRRGDLEESLPNN